MFTRLVERDRGVVDTSASPHARLTGAPVRAVRLGEGFWRPRLEANRLAALPQLYRLLEEHGVVDNFRRVYGAKDAPRRGMVFTDSDLYKWVEAAAFVLQSGDDAATRGLLEGAVAAIVPAQREDGYLNTYYVDERYDQRYTHLDTDHETYCAGHLFQAAIAYRRAVGDNPLFDCARRFADHLAAVIPTMPGISVTHPEVEMAMVEMYRETGEARYLDTAHFVLDDNRFAALQKIEGHAVEAAYFAAGGTDYYAETGDPAFRASTERQWQNLVEAKMYITGGSGGRHEGESLGRDYELPNARAYAETCAAIGNIMWSWRLLGLDGDASYADVLERSLYNGFLAGVSLDGTRYFYVNPLSYDGLGEGDPWDPRHRSGLYERQPWYRCTCCPPNVQRMLASLPGYFYSTSREGLWVHLYDTSELDWRLQDGTPLRLAQKTRYPWEGEVILEVRPAAPAEFTLFLRVPGWTQHCAAKVNGAAGPSATPGSYLALRRTWQPGDRVQLSFEMEPVAMAANPRLAENRGAVALQRGPLVYCLEAHDQPGLSVLDAMLDPAGEVASEWRPDLLGGITVLHARGAVPLHPGGPLYQRWTAKGRATQPAELTAIPYYAWNNRGPCAMVVWMAATGRA